MDGATEPRTGPLVEAGGLPPWGKGDLQAPPPYSIKNALRVTGAGAIILGISIGSGEWLIGPAVTAQFTAALLWVATASILLQWVFNEEASRYTLYTGEPIMSGFMRTKPGPAFWGGFWSILGFIQLGWPGWAASAATAIVAAQIGGVPGPEQAGLVKVWGYATFFASLALLLLGKKVEKALEYAEWFMVFWIIVALLFLGIFFTSFSAWVTVVSGFLGGGAYFIRDPKTGELMGLLPRGTDWFILAGFAAYAGAGGLGNCTVSNWVRDKGMGMAATVGFIPGLVGGLQSAGGALLWYLTLLTGFWILYSTQLGIMDLLPRTVTDILWTSTPGVRRWAKGDVRKVYYATLVVFVVWGCIAINLAQPFILILLGAFVAGLMMSIYGVQVWWVNRKYLPREIQAPLWRQAALLLFSAFFGFFTIVVILQRVFGIKLGW